MPHRTPSYGTSSHRIYRIPAYPIMSSCPVIAQRTPPCCILSYPPMLHPPLPLVAMHATSRHPLSLAPSGCPPPWRDLPSACPLSSPFVCSSQPHCGSPSSPSCFPPGGVRGGACHGISTARPPLGEVPSAHCGDPCSAPCSAPCGGPRRLSSGSARSFVGSPGLRVH